MKTQDFGYIVQSGTSDRGPWRMRLIIVVVASLAANFPGVDGTAGARAEVLTLQGALGALTSADFPSPVTPTGVLAIQRLFGGSEGADAEDGATVLAAVDWATVPSLFRMPAPESAFASTELREANGDADRSPIETEHAPLVCAGERLRYRYHLLANAPPVGGDSAGESLRILEFTSTWR